VQQILPKLYTFTGLYVGRVYLIDDPGGLTIIDAGLALAAGKIVKQLEAKGRKAKDVKRILITHGHIDHIGGLPKLRELTGAEVIAPSGDRLVIEGKEPVTPAPREKLSGISKLMVPSKPPMLKGTPVDREVKGGDVIAEAMGGLQVIDTPGHSPGHVSYWHPENRILFCGDVMMNWRGLRLPFAAYTTDMDEDKRSIKKVAELHPSVVCFGHGPPLIQNAAQAIRDFAAKV
jgi:glyoxylase-like metal-dependent hydrolase (beta-lactamase superfamily II)